MQSYKLLSTAGLLELPRCEIDQQTLPSSHVVFLSLLEVGFGSTATGKEIAKKLHKIQSLPKSIPFEYLITRGVGGGAGRGAGAGAARASVVASRSGYCR